MKLKLMEIEVRFTLIDTELFDVDIINNVIRIVAKNNIPFSGDVVNYIRDQFDEKSFECDFDDNTNCIIYIRAIKEGLFAEIQELKSCPFVKIGYVSKCYEIVDNEEED